MRTWKTLLLSGVILAAAGAAVGIMMNQAPEPEKADATETEWRIESARVEAGFYQPEIRLVGRLEARRQQTFTAAFSAEVMELTVTEGDRVQAGDLLLRLDDFDTRQQRQQAEADLADIESQRQIRQLQQRLDTQALAVATAKLEQLQEQLTKQQQLVTRGLAPQQHLDDLQQQVDQQQLSVLQHRTTIDSHPAELARLDASNRYRPWQR
ncbi:MAG TPA: biotin/lipoyl-binding protein [Saccharospirillum sp.]|nr:biotin/lipoyl-binding protein [Saccharospirillum sp.]